MKINFNMNINIDNWAKACGYKVKGDKIVKEYNLSDFKKAVKEYIESELEFGRNQNTIEENFMINDVREFIEDFEYEHKEDK